MDLVPVDARRHHTYKGSSKEGNIKRYILLACKTLNPRKLAEGCNARENGIRGDYILCVSKGSETERQG